MIELRGRRLAHGQLQFPLPHAQRHPVVPHELLVLSTNGPGALVGDQPDLLVRFAFLAGLRVVDVVDIGAGAVAHGGHKGRIQPIGGQQLLDSIAEHAKVVGGDVLRPVPPT